MSDESKDEYDTEDSEEDEGEDEDPQDDILISREEDSSHFIGTKKKTIEKSHSSLDDYSLFGRKIFPKYRYEMNLDKEEGDWDDKEEYLESKNKIYEEDFEESLDKVHEESYEDAEDTDNEESHKESEDSEDKEDNEEPKNSDEEELEDSGKR